MNNRRKLLWVDGFAGLIAGSLMLLAIDFLERWYKLPRDLLLFIGLANVTYASYSLSLAARTVRAMKFIVLLVGANLFWSVVCLVMAAVYFDVASPFGLAQLVGEALFVGVLAGLEWRWRGLLQTP
ncbi:MAG TPA: hypothetical protein VGB07_35370 [Blastocatellia bacterium]